VLSELSRDGWRVVETDYFEETRVRADGKEVSVGFNWAEDPSTGSEDARNQYDPNVVVKIEMDWGSADHTQDAASEVSFRPGTFFGNWLIVATFLSISVVVLIVTRRPGRKSELHPAADDATPTP
jgi:hypothetical protein